jgi:uridylate kinase
MRIVFVVGGSIVCPRGLPDINYLKKFSRFLVKLRKKHEIIIVTGGGRMTKDYIRTTRKLKPSEKLLDHMGILGTRMNALALVAALGKHAYPKVVENKEELEHGIASKRIVVLGGTVPGQTTDAVAAAAAKFFRADLLVIGTNVRGVYDKDPKKYKNAKMLSKISPREIYRMVKTQKHMAGPIGVMDQVAAKLLAGTKIKTIFLDGRKLDNIKNALQGKKFTGTVIG